MSESEGFFSLWFHQLPKALGEPVAAGRIRSCAEDFQVEEELSFTPDGEGEHLFVRIRKQGVNTGWLAQELARFAGVARRDVGFAGRKDRRAITTQWFSVWLPGKEGPDWGKFEQEGVELLEQVRNRRKLRTGALQQNRFHIRVREFEGDPKELEQRLCWIKGHGFPNYYAEQRFGHDGGNLSMAERMFRGELERLGRNKRSLYLSAARSYLFNLVLADRVTQRDWNRGVAGDRMMLNGARAHFLADEIDEVLQERVARMEIHPTGPLYGVGESGVGSQMDAREGALLDSASLFCDGLVRFGLESARRALRVVATGLEWSWISHNQIEFRFALPSGSYATAMLRELIRS